MTSQGRKDDERPAQSGHPTCLPRCLLVTQSGQMMRLSPRNPFLAISGMRVPRTLGIMTETRHPLLAFTLISPETRHGAPVQHEYRRMLTSATGETLAVA